MKGKIFKFNYVVKFATGNSHKTNFCFRGCGWFSKAANWSKEDELWISAMNKLFQSMYGKDKVQYKFLQGKGTSVMDSDDPTHWCFEVLLLFHGIKCGTPSFVTLM